jgi:beta propeller repeat protein
MKKTLFLAVILLSLCLAPVQADWTMPSANSAININDGSDNQIEFTTSDKYIVYTNYSNDTFTLYLYSIASGETIMLAEQTNDKFQPAIDNDQIVWMVAENGTKFINHYRISTEESTTYFLSRNTYHDTNPYIHDNIITFTRWTLRNGKSNIMSYDIDNDILGGIDSQVNSIQSNQEHFGNTVVWQDKRNDIDEIFIQQEIEDELVISNLSNNGLNHYFPKVFGKNVIWDTKNSVYAKNLDNNTLQIIGNDQYANFYSSISNNNVVYQSSRVGNYDIYLYNLKTQSEIRITNSYQNDESPSISGNILAWRRQNANGQYDIHYTNIKPALEKLYTKLSFSSLSTTDVEITWPITDDANYNNAMLYRSNTNTTIGDLIGNHITDNTYTETNLVPGTTYYYTLTLIDENGYESTTHEQYPYTSSNKLLAKLANSPSVYLIDHDEFYAIGNEDIFLAHGFQWPDINTISQRGLDQYHYAGALKYPSSTLIKGNNATVYLTYNNVARPFAGEEIFIRAGYNWNNIKTIPQYVLNTYEFCDELTIDNFIHSDNTLIKYTYNPNVYLIENGNKRLITSETVFNQYGFSWNDILTIPVYWEYQSGPNL